MKLACVIAVNYSNYELTVKMYESLLESKLNKENFDFLVIDNSEDDIENSKLDDVFHSYSNVTIIKTCNEGYFKGLNLGLNSINPAEYKFVIIANNDIVFSSSFASKLNSAVYDNSFHVICPDVFSSDGYHQNPHVVTRFSLFRRLKMDLYYSNYLIAVFLLLIKKFLFRSKASTKDNVPKKIHMGIGAIYILTRGFFEKNKLLDFPFFLYGEEAFLSNQVHSTSGELYYDPVLVVDHLESATLSKSPNRARYLWGKESYRVYRKYL